MEISRATRSVQKEDVWQAADALLLEGKRPTIERVRQKIGRGSPNTVSPMLEAWFATLGPRLGGAGEGTQAAAADPASGKGLPSALVQAMQQLWEQVQTLAAQAADAQLEPVRLGLQAQQQALDDAQHSLEQERSQLAQQRATTEQALAVAHAQIKMQGTRLTDLEQAGRQKDQFAAAQQQRLQALEQELFANRKARDDADMAHAEQLRELQHNAQLQQHRVLQDLDRARQETKQAMAAQRAEQEKLARLEAQWQQDRQALEEQRAQQTEQLQQSQAQVQQLQHRLQTAEAAHTQTLALQAHQHESALAQFRLELAHSAAAQSAGRAGDLTQAGEGVAGTSRRPMRSAVAVPRPMRMLPGSRRRSHKN
ncbi:DNA repair exonuclease SbcCD ATPase subunit [Comamonas sp. BIGb0152]|uniref:DNA-binding protein n=1 Tax=Comamonas sp. BIGb0152 TaxID=2940601 RepID=UPI0021674D29|nr:DNA-binding protein [Comamonas sp. BIGb0152]MCS4292941.1 DNA repair exonuclease SbcCD ATPase subunit [Comamonas sp. BIGb0152]